jgi:hypothetical protein
MIAARNPIPSTIYLLYDGYHYSCFQGLDLNVDLSEGLPIGAPLVSYGYDVNAEWRQ